MKIIHRPRQAGKTTEIVEWVKEDPEENRIIVVRTQQEKDWLIQHFRLKQHQVETWNTILRGCHSFMPRSKNLFIDNLDMYLWETFGEHASLEGFSLTKELK